MIDAGHPRPGFGRGSGTAVAESGDIVVALLDQEATVKRLSIRDERIELRPENPKHRPMPIGPDDGLRILGKVVAIRRLEVNTSNPGANENNR